MQSTAVTALASAQPLPAAVQQWLWHKHGSAVVRRTLAGRDDLDPTLARLAMADSDESVVRAWLTVPGRDARLLTMASRLELSEHCLTLLATQRNLSSRVVDRLLELDSEAVFSQLLLRPRLSTRQRVAAARGLSGSRVRTGWNDAQYLIDHVGALPAAWVASLDVAPTGSTAVTLAASLSCPDDPQVCEAIVSWWEAHGLGRNHDAIRDCARAMGALLSSGALSTQLAQRIEALAPDDQVSQAASRRGLLDVDRALHAVTGGDPDPVHLTTLAMATLDGVKFRRTDVLVAALRTHDPAAISQPLSVLVRNATSDEVREAVDTLAAAGELDHAVALVESCKSVLGLEGSIHAAQIVPLLAARGFSELLRSRLAYDHATPVAMNFTPLADALWVSDVAGAVLARVEELSTMNPAWAETALTLLPTWQGTLPELLSASVALGGAPNP